MGNLPEGTELPDILDARDLERRTGTKASTWRYWASKGIGPASFKIGRRRVWKKSVVLAWLAKQEQAAS
jgi:prophage regulatory protein